MFRRRIPRYKRYRRIVQANTSVQKNAHLSFEQLSYILPILISVLIVVTQIVIGAFAHESCTTSPVRNTDQIYLLGSDTTTTGWMELICKPPVINLIMTHNFALIMMVTNIIGLCLLFFGLWMFVRHESRHY